MASIRKRENKWQAQVRRRDAPALTRSFHNKADADAWARQQEVQIDKGELLVGTTLLKEQTLGNLLLRYEAEVTPHKKGADSERYRLRALIKSDISSHRLDRLTPGIIASYRDRRLQVVSGAWVRRELTILRHCIEKARKEWGVPLPGNPVAALEKPKDTPPRARRVTLDDALKLSEGLLRTRNPLLREVIQFALATGMRRGEILGMRWKNVDKELKTAFLPETKNGKARTVPLSPQARAILLRIQRHGHEDVVFPITANALRLSWERLKRRAGIEDLRFHDLRHEAISRFFEQGLSVPEVSLISGHRDPQMLFRYAHLRAADVAEKLERAAGAEHKLS